MADRDSARPGRLIAAALLYTRDGRYLMQHRDTTPGIDFPEHWCCFGGGVEPGETPAAALFRELQEEIEYRPRAARLFTEIAVAVPYSEPRYDRLLFFAAPFLAGDLARLRQHEGESMALRRPDDLAVDPMVVPWDLAAILMHARRHTLFRA